MKHEGSLPEQARGLERALAEGRLAAALAEPEAGLDPRLAAVYRGLALTEPGSPEARAPWVAQALRAHAEALGPVRRAFGAVALPVEAQVRARAWGAGFTPAVEAAAQAAADARLVTDLRGVSTIATAHHGVPAFSDDRLGAALERLMHDVLALRWPTRFAPLLEDALEQTDLRVKVPGHSKRGVRVQVGASLPGARHARKLARAKRAGVVLLSPATLAQGVERVPGAAALLPPGGLAVQARAIRDQLTQAIARPVAEPGGPAARLPAPIHGLVAWVVVGGAPKARGPKRRHRPGPLG